MAKKTTRPANAKKQSALNAAAISHVVGMISSVPFCARTLAWTHKPSTMMNRRNIVFNKSFARPTRP